MTNNDDVEEDMEAYFQRLMRGDEVDEDDEKLLQLIRDVITESEKGGD